MAQIDDVLFVDDDPDMHDIVQMGLSVAGWTVRSVESAKEALHALQERLPDLILLDATLTGLDGLEALEIMRSQGGDGVPVVFLTGRVRHKEVEQYLAAGASGVIAKPFDPTTLADEIERIVEL